MEVNEASCVIQESAHEDANIIFGAVIDPNISGKLKITVIATGFDRKGSSRSIPAAAISTPTDLGSYTAHIAAARASAESAPPQPVMQASAPAEAIEPPPFTMTRRPALELSLPLMTEPGGAGEPGRAGGADHGLDLSSPFDIPAFLRRQN